eukprot:MONOS_2371.1-p1 / transcript=MONOS_2371.1 / gene=MONOS_2371 / organism=Monocercomonoides_exilis_PA203 / gene_product=metallo-beta-lactamase family protein / transcript_product=metallo-beta-lactamase family protein / location=Mono_scaffold00048:155919-156921(-) / protein_length=208 / sequence_SO=supercontig / SO=protein_coding / is_pseudo=false
MNLNELRSNCTLIFFPAFCFLEKPLYFFNSIMSLEVVYFPVGDLQANTIIVSDPKTKDAVIFDAGGNIPKILDAVKKADVKVHHVYYTHGHFDHVDLSGVLAKELQCPVTLHPADNDLYRNSPTLMRMLGVKCSFATVPPVDVHHEGDKIRVGDVEGVILHTPGHSPGSCSFSFPNLLISGDTLFQGNYGWQHGTTSEIYQRNLVFIA